MPGHVEKCITWACNHMLVFPGCCGACHGQHKFRLATTEQGRDREKKEKTERVGEGSEGM